MTISLKSVDKRLEDIANHVTAGNFELADSQGRVLVEDLVRASRPVQPKRGVAGAGPSWDPNHQLYAAALPYLRGAIGHVAQADAAATLESINKARNALLHRIKA